MTPAKARRATASEPAVIEAQGLVKQFGTTARAVTAVDGIDLLVRSGETFGLIGPDGAGKTTTIRVILGLLRRTSGTSSILGHDSMRDAYAIREHVGYIAQQFALSGDLTVMENIRFFADVHGVRPREQRRRIPELLDFAGLTRFGKRLGSRLSGGMKKKLALACSLVHEPQVLVLDEPTLGVDPVSRREFWNLLSDLRAEKGVTILVCTPYMDEAERCSCVGLMYEGRLVAQDTPRAITRAAPGRLLEFTPSRFELAKQVAGEVEGVLEVQTYGAMLHVFVDAGPEAGIEDRMRAIERALSDRDCECRSMREIEPRMEEAFISLIRRQEYGTG